MARTPGTELYEYMPPSAGVREQEQQGPAFPYYLSDRPRPGAAGGNGGVPRGPDTNLRAIGKVITAGTIAGMLFGAPIWGKPILSLARYPNAKDPIALIAKAIDVLTAWFKPRLNKLSHDMSQGAVHLNGDLTHTLDLLAVRLDQIVLNEAYIAADAAYSTGRLVHFKIPQTVQRSIRPVRLRVGRVERLTGKALLQVRALRTQLRRDIRRLQREQIDPLKKPVRVTLPGRIHRVERDVRTIKRTQTHDHNLVRKLTFILVPTLAAAWLVKTLIRAGLRYTTCQNVKDIGNELCASPPGTGRKIGRFLRDLFSGVGGFLAPLFVCQIFTAAHALIGPVMSEVVAVVGNAGAALCNGQRTAAPPLPLETHALPQPTNALPI